MIHNDPLLRRRRLAVPAGNVIQVGTDRSKVALGLHPRLTGLRQIFDRGSLALIQRTGYPDQSRSHFRGTDIWATANPANPSGYGWIGRYLDTLQSPLDPLTGWNTTRELPRVLQSEHVAIPAIPNTAAYAFVSPNARAEAAAERNAAVNITSHVPIDRPELAFVYSSAQAAMATLDRVATVATYCAIGAYRHRPEPGASSVADAMVRGIGTKVCLVTTGGLIPFGTECERAQRGVLHT